MIQFNMVAPQICITLSIRKGCVLDRTNPKKQYPVSSILSIILNGKAKGNNII